MNTSSKDNLSEGKKNKKGGRLSKLTNIFKKDKDNKKNKNNDDDEEEVFYDAYAAGTEPNQMTTE